MTLRIGVQATSVNPARQQAFTLIELILVMCMLIVIIGVAAPALSTFFHGRNLHSEAKRFLALTRYGQSRAVSEGAPMVLWVDVKQGLYGLEQEASYMEIDTQAKEFEVEKEMTIEVADIPVQTVSSTQMTQNGRNRASIRFLPDGFISETSVQTIILREEKSGAIEISLSLNGLNYEIQTNVLQNSRR